MGLAITVVLFLMIFGPIYLFQFLARLDKRQEQKRAHREYEEKYGPSPWSRRP